MLKRLLCGCFGRSWCGGFGGYFWSGDRINLYGRQHFLQAVEDLVAVNVLHESSFRCIGGDVEGELVAGSVLEDMEVLRVALARAFSGDGFGGAEFEITEHQLGVGGRVSGRGRRCSSRFAGASLRTPV